MVVTNDETLHSRALHFKGQGLAAHRQYWHDVIGYNYRMSNICAALGLAQLEQAGEFLRRKREIAALYKAELTGTGVTLQGEADNALNSHWMCSILVADAAQRDPLREHLAHRGVETRPVFYPVHTMPMYSGKFQRHLVAEDIGWRGINLPGWPGLSDEQVRQTHLEEPILYRSGTPVPVDDLVLSNGLFLGLDLRGDERGQVGHSTRDSAPLLDLTSGGEVDPMPFWDPVFREDGDRLVLSPKRFYLLMSNEAVSIPPNLAAEMTAYDPTSGELRTHYAGFFDPGFGFDPTGGFRGSRAALEVRAHDVPFMVENGQAVCKLTFERMLEEPTSLYGSGIGSSYQQQEETLSRYFRRSRK